MVKNIIKIGSSAGVTIPKKELESKGLKIGDPIDFKYWPAHKSESQEELMKDYKKFVKQYGQTLKNLAKR